MAESKETVTAPSFKQKIEELRQANAVLQAENEMFESFLSRLDSLNLVSQPAPQMEKGAAAVKDPDMRQAEIKTEKNVQQFADGTQQTTEKSLSRTMVRRSKSIQMQPLKQQRMVHQTKKIQVKLRWIDLEHLKQINIQHQESLQKLQEQLLSQRLLVRKSQQRLNAYKERLKMEMQESELLSRKIALHEEKLFNIREKQQKLVQERAQAEALNKKLKANLANFHVPEITKYIEAKSTNDQLRQTIKALERNVRIAKMTSKSKKNSSEEPSSCSRSDDQ